MASFQRIIPILFMLVLAESAVPWFPRCRLWPIFRPRLQVPAGEELLRSDHVFYPSPVVAGVNKKQGTNTIMSTSFALNFVQ